MIMEKYFKKVDDVVMAFEKYGIRYRRRKYYGEDAHAGGWLDISDLATKGVQKKKIQNYSINVCIPLPFRDIFYY